MCECTVTIDHIRPSQSARHLDQNPLTIPTHYQHGGGGWGHNSDRYIILCLSFSWLWFIHTHWRVTIHRESYCTVHNNTNCLTACSAQFCIGAKSWPALPSWASHRPWNLLASVHMPSPAHTRSKNVDNLVINVASFPRPGNEAFWCLQCGKS